MDKMKQVEERFADFGLTWEPEKPEIKNISIQTFFKTFEDQFTQVPQPEKSQTAQYNGYRQGVLLNLMKILFGEENRIRIADLDLFLSWLYEEEAEQVWPCQLLPYKKTEKAYNLFTERLLPWVTVWLDEDGMIVWTRPLGILKKLLSEWTPDELEAIQPGYKMKKRFVPEHDAADRVMSDFQKLQDIFIAKEERFATEILIPISVEFTNQFIAYKKRPVKPKTS